MSPYEKQLIEDIKKLEEAIANGQIIKDNLKGYQNYLKDLEGRLLNEKERRRAEQLKHLNGISKNS